MLPFCDRRLLHLFLLLLIIRQSSCEEFDSFKADDIYFAGRTRFFREDVGWKPMA